MDRNPHCPFVFRKNLGDEAHRGGERDGRPGEKEDGADDDRLPVGEKITIRYPNMAMRIEDEEGFLVTEAIAQIAAGV